MKSSTGTWILRLLAVLAAFAFITASCGDDDDAGVDAPPDESDDTDNDAVAEPFDLTVALSADPATLDPHESPEIQTQNTIGNVYETLVRRSTDGSTLEPLLAESLPEAVDDTTWEVAINSDARFASGDPVTAGDVVYSFERFLDPNFDNTVARFFETTENVEAVDESTVRFTTSAPDPVFTERLVSAYILQEGQGDVAGWPQSGHNGSGPYAFVSFDRGVGMELEKRDDYWGDAESAPQTVTYRIIPEQATQIAALQAGELDIVQDLGPDQLEQVPVPAQVNGTETVFIRTNSLDGPLTDPLLREAAKLAIDREGIVEALFGGDAELANCQIGNPVIFGHTEGLPVPEHNPDRAAQLVSENYGGEPLTFMATIGRFPKHDEVAQVVLQDLQDAGFNVELIFPESEEVIGSQFLGQKAEYVDLFMWSASSELFDLSQPLDWVRSEGPFSAADNTEIDRLANEAISTLDDGTRQELYDQLNTLGCDDAINLYLYSPALYYGLSEDIDWQPRPDRLIILTDVAAS